MITFEADNFNLEQIAISGQCFRMDKCSDSYKIIATDKMITARQEGRKITLDTTKKDFENFWKNYFDLEADYGKYINAVDASDKYLKAAVSSCPGLRILNQDLWEMIVTFLISQQNNIPRIKKCVNNICEKYGKKLDDVTYAFPEAEALAALPEDALMACNLGYRSKYVVRTAREIASGSFDLDALKKCNYEEARRRLLSLYGVGVKVADCICLFALHHIEAFPIDTHIKKVLAEHYADGFPFDRYDGFAGIMQQYIFYYDLNGAGK